MRRLVPARMSRDYVKLDDNGKVVEEVVRIIYEIKDVSDEEYESAQKLHLALLEHMPAPWSDKSKM